MSSAKIIQHFSDVCFIPPQNFSRKVYVLKWSFFFSPKYDLLNLVSKVHAGQINFGGRLFARSTFTTPKIRTFPTPKFGHLTPPKTVHLPGGLPPPIFFLFLAHISWFFTLTANGEHQGWEGGGAWRDGHGAHQIGGAWHAGHGAHQVEGGGGKAS